MERNLIEAVVEARSMALDAARPEAVIARHQAGHLTARERIAALCDQDSFVEYGILASARDDSMEGAADGVVAGAGRVNGHPVVVASYDYTVFRGTQSNINTGKIERLLFIANNRRWPFICFNDGDGSRKDESGAPSGLWTGGQTPMGIFDGLAELSGCAPSIAILSGAARDGHAAIAMNTQFCIATAGSTLGMGEATLPVEVHEGIGDVDRILADESAAIDSVRQLLSYFQYDESGGEESPAAHAIGEIVPDNRRRAYDIRKVIDALADDSSVFELRPNWGTSMVTSLARLEGRAVGIFGNQPKSRLAGAIDSDAADKMARFIELCSAYDLPLVSLIDSPGFYIGPDAERAGIARHHIRTLASLENRKVPLYCVQIRKSYGLGPLVMRGSGGRLPPEMRLAWPTVETGGMSLEGAAYIVKRKEIQAAATPEEARAIRDDYANSLRDRNSGLRAGQNFSFDEIVDPAETRGRIVAMLRLSPRPARSEKATYLDTI